MTHDFAASIDPGTFAYRGSNQDLKSLHSAVVSHCIKFRECFDKQGRALDWCVDLRALLYRPLYLNMVCTMLWKQIKDLHPDFIGGMTLSAEQLTAGLLQVALSDGRDIAGFSVRRVPKPYGTRRQIEGVIPTPGSRVVIVDDLIDSGGTVGEVRRLLEASKAIVVGCAAVIDFHDPAWVARLGTSLPKASLFRLDEFGLVNSHAVPIREPHWIGRGVNGGEYTAPQSTPWIDADGVIAAGDTGYVIAWDHHGIERWRFRISDRSRGVRTVIERIDNSILFAGYDGRVYRVRRDTGVVEWSTSVGVFIGTSLTIDRHRDVVFLAANHAERSCEFLALDVSQGQVLWRTAANAWSYARPALVDPDGVVFAANDGRLHCLTRADGAICWTAEMGAPVKGWIASNRQACYVGTFDGHLCAIAAADGHALWRRRLADWLLVHPVILGEVVLVAGGSHLGAFDSQDGSLQWARPSGRVTGLAITPNANYALGGNDAGDCFCLDLRAGEYRWRFHAPAAFRATPAVTNEWCLIPCYDGNVYGFALDS